MNYLWSETVTENPKEKVTKSVWPQKELDINLHRGSPLNCLAKVTDARFWQSYPLAKFEVLLNFSSQMHYQL